MSDDFSTMTGKLPARLANACTRAAEQAFASGMGVDEVASVMAAVAADIGRANYGDRYLIKLMEVIRCRPETPLPVLKTMERS